MPHRDRHFGLVMVIVCAKRTSIAWGDSLGHTLEPCNQWLEKEMWFQASTPMEQACLVPHHFLHIAHCMAQACVSGYHGVYEGKMATIWLTHLEYGVTPAKY